MIDSIFMGFILIVLTIILFVKFFIKTGPVNQKFACIVVLGDLGRSPRMNYHCLSLVKLGYQVTMIGYAENKQLDQIEANKNINIHPLSPYPKILQAGPQVFQYGLKVVFLSLNLFIALLRLKYVPKFVLVQNPPSVPTLGLVFLFSKLTGAKFIIDWHNYGFTIMSLKSGPTNILVRICKKFEIYFGQKSDLNLCVTSAMKEDLSKFGIKATTMYDKAHERFHKMEISEKNVFYSKLIDTYNIIELKEEKIGNNILTELKNGHLQMKQKRPALIVSSSSWTEDEDFDLLVDAFDIYQNQLNSHDSNIQMPDIMCFLTGKGPLKEYYQKKFEQKKYNNIKVFFLWLEPSDYPSLLGSCDLGVCFHKSSSNLDLPMKVVDMFGTRLPVCALEFSCISELVKNNFNGLLFSNSNQLANHFSDLLQSLNHKDSQLEIFRKNLESFSNWDQEWNSKVKPLMLSI